MKLESYQANTPKDLFDSCGKGLAWVIGFGRTETYQLGTGEGEGRRDEYGAESFEAIVESTGIIPEEN